MVRAQKSIHRVKGIAVPPRRGFRIVIPGRSITQCRRQIDRIVGRWAEKQPVLKFITGILRRLKAYNIMKKQVAVLPAMARSRLRKKLWFHGARRFIARPPHNFVPAVFFCPT